MAKELKLFKTTAVIHVMSMATSKAQADKIAINNINNEFKYVSYSSAKVVMNSDIPASWRDVIPYHPNGVSIQDKTCSSIVPFKEASVAVPDKVVAESTPEVVNEPEAIPEPVEPVRPSFKPPLRFDIPIKPKNN